MGYSDFRIKARFVFVFFANKQNLSKQTVPFYRNYGSSRFVVIILQETFPHSKFSADFHFWM